jgi:hypothetical protein
MSGPEIAAALEGELSLHPVTVGRKGKPRLELDAGRAVTLNDLVSSSGDR